MLAVMLRNHCYKPEVSFLRKVSLWPFGHEFIKSVI